MVYVSGGVVQVYDRIYILNSILSVRKHLCPCLLVIIIIALRGCQGQDRDLEGSEHILLPPISLP